MLTKTIALLLTVVGAASASKLQSSPALKGEDPVQTKPLFRKLTGGQKVDNPPELSTYVKTGTDEPPFGNANGQDKEMKSCENPLTITLQAATGVDTFFLLFAGALVFFMQAGFAMLSAGSVRQKDVKNIMLKNMLDAVGGALGFWSVGYGADADKKGFIGNSGFFLGQEEGTAALQLQVLGTFILWVGQCGSCWAFSATRPTLASILSELGALLDTIPIPAMFTATAATIVASVNEVMVKEEDDGSVSVGYGLNLCKEDESDFDDEEVEGLKGIIKQELEEFIMGLAGVLGVEGLATGEAIGIVG